MTWLAQQVVTASRSAVEDVSITRYLVQFHETENTTGATIKCVEGPICGDQILCNQRCGV
jgi:hypothetical protein